MKNPKKLLEDKEGVSPVIGVILMVAITVIMAAIVAGFVFGVISTPQPTPQASVTISSMSTDAGGNLSVTILHQSGDSLNVSDTKVVVTNLANGSQVTTTLDNTNAVDSTGAEFSTGERVTIDTQPLGPLQPATGDNIEVRLVDIPSGGTISQPSQEYK